MNLQSDDLPRSRSGYSTPTGAEIDMNAHDGLTDALQEVCAALDAGTLPDRDALLKKYASVASDLSGCLDALDFVRRLGPELSETDQASPEEATEEPTPTRLGDFLIRREIGRGGMGIVYEAEQLSLGRRVALKVLPFAAMLDAKQLHRFKNEAKAAATLHHTSIVPVYSVGRKRGVHYYAMQYIQGESLSHLLAAMRKLTARPKPRAVRS